MEFFKPTRYKLGTTIVLVILFFLLPDVIAMVFPPPCSVDPLNGICIPLARSSLPISPSQYFIDLFTRLGMILIASYFIACALVFFLKKKPKAKKKR